MEASKMILYPNTTINQCPADIVDCGNLNFTYNSSRCNSNLTEDANCVDYHVGIHPSYLAIVSSILSCLGSALIVLAFLIFKDIRGGMAQRIVTALAIADFVSAAGYIVGSLNFIMHYNVEDARDCGVFQTVCEIQAFVTSWSSLSSFAWTTILALYFYFVLVHQKQRPFNTKYRQLALHFISWGAPGLILIPFTALGYLGYAPFAASNWCFVADPSLKNASSHPGSFIDDILPDTAKVLAAGKFWEILTYFVVIVVYSHIFFILEKMRRNVQRNNYEVIAAPERAKVERKMVYIPVIFLMLRIWGTAQFFLNIGMEATYPMSHGCILKGFYTAFSVLGYLQAIGDPGQGWGNALLYVFLSDSIRKRMVTGPLGRCCRKIAKEYIEQTHHLSGSNPGSTRERRDRAQIQKVPENDRSREASTVATRRITNEQSTITDMKSHAGPLAEPARPGPSPIHGVRKLEHLSETTTTTTTVAVHV